MISQWEGSGSTCPTWFYSGPGGCQCGDPLHGACICDSETERVYLSVCYCMTYSEDTNDTVTSSCLLSCFSADRNSTFFGVPQNVSELNEMMCSNMNRDGQLCGSCKDGFALPVYSYSMQCVQTTRCVHHSTWWKYILVAFLPLTVLYVIVVTFRINATSPVMNGFVLVSQIISTPYQIRGFELYRHVKPQYEAKLPLDIVASVYGIWNLDFFRTVYTPFCLHPEMTNIQTLALDYIIAVYPLILITVTYLLVELHDWGFRPIIWLWRPFHRCFVRFRRQWNIRTALIDAFVTFFLLSYYKASQCVIRSPIPGINY